VSEVNGQLRFSFHELAEEIDALQSIAAAFIAPRSAQSLQQLTEQLEGLWSAAPGRALRWELAELWTIISYGEYEPAARRGSRNIVGAISGIWDVRPIGSNSSKPKERRKRLLEFCGIASTRVRLFDAEDMTSPIAMWRMELGDAVSPGCYFHVQVLGEDEATPFPKSVSVPRLPTMFVSPMGVIEYVLGELFQERWSRAAMENSGNVLRWTGLQKERLVRLLKWHLETVERSLTSPWMALKQEKPDAKLFLAP
jgi:hypothetical protein